MPKIKALTSFYDNRMGPIATNEVKKVPHQVAKEMVEEKGYAEYVEDPIPTEEVDGVEFPVSFLDKSLPEKFPHVELLREDDVKTFRDLAQIRDYTTIKEIGDNRAEEVKEGFRKVLDKMTE